MGWTMEISSAISQKQSHEMRSVVGTVLTRRARPQRNHFDVVRFNAHSTVAKSRPSMPVDRPVDGNAAVVAVPQRGTHLGHAVHARILHDASVTHDEAAVLCKRESEKKEGIADAEM